MTLPSELSSVQLYPGSAEAVRSLQAAGYKVGVCPNLALRYD